ncbi:MULTISPECIES: cobalt-precorrin-7 (C(5))-methyltransferase [Natrialbaceae]|uniref:cobalt-precorrin-7 (C(5))-methyltransferase n=1 Tax=Natrialbaceae TaxID=1644061 RepID=UPI00207C3758|nr:cobalt-precorrin-7 (C(5))-methyltransferase [Natronococcus sp. CG52]
MSGEYDLDAGPDPATFAAGSPERDVDEETDEPVYAVGVGPGNLEYLTPRGERAIREADVVVGFTTVVEFVEDLTDADLLTCGYRDEAEALEEFGERVAAGESGTAVAMGDPNHSGYQFVGKVQDAVEHGSTSPDSHARQDAGRRDASSEPSVAGAPEDAVERAAPDRPVRIVPGISSLQMAASRARTPMEDAEFVTLHKSGDLAADMDRLASAVHDRHLLVLPRPYDRMPGDVAAFLLENGAEPDLEALVLEKLTHEDEEIHRFTLAELSEHAGGDGRAETPFSDLVVLAVRQPV